MNQEVCKHYEDKAAEYRTRQNRIAGLEMRLKSLNDSKSGLSVYGDSITYYFDKDRARELKTQVACWIRDEIKLIEQEMEAL